MNTSFTIPEFLIMLILITHFLGENQDRVPEPEEFRDGTLSFVIPKKISLSSNETVY